MERVKPVPPNQELTLVNKPPEISEGPTVPIPFIEAANNQALSPTDINAIRAYLPVLEEKSEQEQNLHEDREVDAVSCMVKGNGAILMDRSQEELITRAYTRISNNITSIETQSIDSVEANQQKQDKDALLALRAQIGSLYAKGLLRLAVNVANKYKGRGIPFEDLIQEANMGILETMKNFDPEKGYRLSTFAMFWIRQKIGRTIQNDSRTIRIPVHAQEKLSHIDRAINDYLIQFGVTPTTDIMSRTTGYPEETIEELLLLRNNSKTSSLDIPNPHHEGFTLAETITTSNSMEEEVGDVYLSKNIEGMLDTLPDRERLILELRYGLKDGEEHTLAGIAKDLGLSRERVRQLEISALRKLQASYSSKRSSYFE